MFAFLAVFFVLAGIAAMAIRTSRKIDRMADAEWEAVDDHHKMEMCRDAIIGNVCGFKCDTCAWHVPEETEDGNDQ